MWQLEFQGEYDRHWIPWHKPEELEPAVQRANDYIRNYRPNYLKYSLGTLRVRILETSTGEVIPVEAFGI